MDFTKIVQTMLLVGRDLPAYKALLDQVIAAFSTEDQDKLRQSYADALDHAAQAHAAAQQL